jgi:cell division protein ZapA
MNSDSRLVQVEIFGQPYRLRADEESGYVETLASYVDSRMREVARQTKAVDSLKIAVLTALNIADDFHRQKGEASESEAAAAPEEAAPAGPDAQEIENRITEWSQLLDEALGG